MRELIETLFGVYEPVTYEMVAYASDGAKEVYTVIASGLAGVDWTWLAGVGLFAIVLYSFFRLLGVILGE